MLSKNISYVEHGTNKYYIAYLNGGFKPLHIIKDIKLYTKHMNVLVNDNELLKYIKIWNKTESLFNGVALNKKFHEKDFIVNSHVIINIQEQK